MKTGLMIEFFIGIWMILTALAGYISEPENMVEMTFLSSLLGGVLFLADAATGARRQLLFLMLAVTFFMEFFITVGGTLSGAAHFNFAGPMLFLHALNPAVVVVWYCLVKGRNGFRAANILCAPLFVLAFLLFDYVRFLHTGTLIYGMVRPQDLTVKAGILIAAGTYGTMLLPACLLAWTGSRISVKTNKTA